MHPFSLVLLALSAAVKADETLKIHGKEVTKECQSAYVAAFVPEKKRTEAFVSLAAMITEPAALKERAAKASTALSHYQDVLTKIDGKLAEPLTTEEKKELEDAGNGTDDVSATLKEISRTIKAPGYNGPDSQKATLSAFEEARKAELEAGRKVETACPDDLD